MTEEQKRIIHETRMDIWIKFVNGGVTVITPEQFVENMKEKRKDPKMRKQIVSIVKGDFPFVKLTKIMPC